MCTEPFVFLKRDKEDYGYVPGGDIDILARNAQQLTREILHLSSGLIIDELSLKINKHEEHYHIDYMENDEIIVRLDIIDTLDGFKRLLLDYDEYAHLAFRLLEYAKCPHKKKHLKHVKDVLSRR